MRRLLKRTLGRDTGLVSAARLCEARCVPASREVDLIVLDLALPDGSGAELSRDPQRDPPILLFTATESAPEVAGAVARSLIKTRATPGELAATVDELLRRRVALRQLLPDLVIRMTELRKILHVEDEPDIRTLAKLALERIGGLEVLSCAGADEAVAQAGEFQPQLVLLDLMMPGKDGIATYRELRSVAGLEQTPVVFMTARVRETDIAQLKSLGAVDVVAKPFDPMTLAQRLQTLWTSLGADGAQEQP